MSEANITEFRFAMPNYEPYSFACANSTPFSVGRTLKCLNPGASYELFQTYVEAMGVKPKLIWISVNDYGSYENGTWTKSLGMILNGTLDTIAATYQYTDLRYTFFDFSYAFYDVKLVYLVKEVKESGLESILDVFVPFELDVWLLYLTFTIALLMAFTFISANVTFNMEPSDSGPVRSISNSVWDFFRYLISSSGEDIELYSCSGYVLFISAGILTVIMMNLYSGILLSQLLTDRNRNPFSSAEEVLNLIEQGKYKMIFDQSNPVFWYYQEATYSNDTHYVELRKALSKNPYVFADNQTHSMELVSMGGYILPRSSDDSTLYAAFNSCDVAFISPEGFPLKYATYIFRKGSPLLQLFNGAVISTQRLTDRIWSVYYGDKADEKRANNCRRSNTLRPLAMSACYGLIALLVVGFLFATFMFIAELIKKWLTPRILESKA